MKVSPEVSKIDSPASQYPLQLVIQKLTYIRQNSSLYSFIYTFPLQQTW